MLQFCNSFSHCLPNQLIFANLKQKRIIKLCFCTYAKTKFYYLVKTDNFHRKLSNQFTTSLAIFILKKSSCPCLYFYQTIKSVVDPTQVFSAGIVPSPLSDEKRKGSKSKARSSVKRRGNSISVPANQILKNTPQMKLE